MNRRLLINLILPLLLLTCYLPPYNEDLSLALLSARRMKHEATIGPLHVWRGEFEGKDYFYIPLKGYLNRGFIASVGDYHIQLSFVADDGFGHYWIEAGWGEGLTNSDKNTLNYRVETVKSGDYIGLVCFDADDYNANKLWVLEYLSSSLQYLFVYLLRDQFWTDLGFSAIAVGSQIYPDQNPAFDRIHFLCKLDSGDYSEVSYEISSAGLLTPGTIRSPFFLDLPADLENAFYYYHPPSNTSFVSLYSEADGGYKNYSWDSSLTLKPLNNIRNRIDALLSTGELFCRTTNMGYVYSQDGTGGYKFPLAGLHFVYEYYLAGEYRMFFTLPYWQDEKLFFRVYSIATADLPKLD